MRDEAERLHNVVQLSAPQAVVADDVDEAVEKVFSTFVVDPGPQRRNTRSQAIATLREAYLRALPSREFVHEKVVGRIGRQRLEIDFAVANGHLAQLSHAWSFRAQNTQATVEKIKAWSWTLRDIREGGGTISVSRREEPYILSGDVPVEVIYDAPTTDQGKRSLDESLEVFGNLEVHAIEAERVALVASDALRSLVEPEPRPRIGEPWRPTLEIEPPGDDEPEP